VGSCAGAFGGGTLVGGGEFVVGSRVARLLRLLVRDLEEVEKLKCGIGAFRLALGDQAEGGGEGLLVARLLLVGLTFWLIVRLRSNPGEVTGGGGAEEEVLSEKTL